MIFTKTKNTFLVFCAISLLASLYYNRSLSQHNKRLESQKQQAVVALAQAQADTERLRAQYLQIQEVVDDVAEQKQQLQQRTAKLQQALLQSQRKTPCFSEPVPDDVTQRLRQHAAEINAAAAGAR